MDRFFIGGMFMYIMVIAVVFGTMAAGHFKMGPGYMVDCLPWAQGRLD